MLRALGLIRCARFEDPSCVIDLVMKRGDLVEKRLGLVERNDIRLGLVQAMEECMRVRHWRYRHPTHMRPCRTSSDSLSAGGLTIVLPTPTALSSLSDRPRRGRGHWRPQSQISAFQLCFSVWSASRSYADALITNGYFFSVFSTESPHSGSTDLLNAETQRSNIVRSIRPVVFRAPLTSSHCFDACSP